MNKEQVSAEEISELKEHAKLFNGDLVAALWDWQSTGIPEDAEGDAEEIAEMVAGKRIMYEKDFIEATSQLTAALQLRPPLEGERVESHDEIIVCQECKAVQKAKVEHTIPFATFVHTCENCGYVIMESEWVKATDEEKAFYEYREAKAKLGTLGWNTFINSKEVEEYREWLRNDKYKHRIDWFEKEYPDGLYHFDKELNDYVGIRLMTKKFLAEADAAYEKSLSQLETDKGMREALKKIIELKKQATCTKELLFVLQAIDEAAQLFEPLPKEGQ